MSGSARTPASVLAAVAVALGGCAPLTGPSSPTATGTTGHRLPAGGVATGAATSAGTAAPTSVAAPTGAAGRATSRKVAQAELTHEYPSGRPPTQRPASPAPSPVAAIRAFATLYINWTAQTVTADMRLLAALSIGQARSAMQLAAANTAQDYELQRGGIANSGTVEAVAPVAAGNDEFIVVTRERTTATNTASYQGLRPAWHLTLARVSRVGRGRWALSEWQPEN